MTTRPATVPYTANDGTEIRNRYWSGADDTTDLVVMLPGLGYTLDGALLRYTAQAAAQRGADVFGIEYPFQAAGTGFDRSKTLELLEDINGALAAHTRSRDYQRVVLVGKSLGTGLARALQDRLSTVVGRVLLTPVPGAPLEIAPTLAVIGTADQFYGTLADQIAAPVEGVRWAVLDDLNHSLEHPSDWRVSLNMLTHTIHLVDTFLQETLA